MKYAIYKKHCADLMFFAEIDCAEDAPDSLRKRLAVKWALKNGADLRGSDLRRADLYGAELYRADLQGADLCVADLCDANLRDADLYGADLYGANLRGTYLRGANLGGARSIVAFGPVGQLRRIGYAVAHNDTPRIQLGCFWGTLDEACAAIRTKYGDNSAYEALVRAASAALAEQEPKP